MAAHRYPHQPPSKRDFIGKPAPPGYIAGVGRGATGFTTRSDIGPAREFASSADDGKSSARHKDQSTSRAGTSRADQADDNEEDQYLNESNYDEFSGYVGSLFSKDPYEEDDEEADKIYDAVERHMDERGKALREAKNRQELELYRTKRPKIQQQFSDLKAGLREVSELEWMNIPEVGDARNRKQRVARQDKFTPVPDSLIAHQAKLATGGEKTVYLDPKAMNPDDDSDEDDEFEDKQSNHKTIQPFDDKQSLNIGEMSEFRSSYMSMKLSRVSDTAATIQSKASTNPQDYLTNLASSISDQITDQATLNEYRKQFSSLRTSNPTFQNAWIASIRLEEAAGMIKQAQNLALEACERIPKSPDLWLEAIRLQPRDKGRALMIEALKENPRSVKLWLKAADLEVENETKRKIFEKAREIVPKSAILWRKSVEIEPPERAREILREAVECCPDGVELWLALARLEPYERAKQVLVRASEINPTNRQIWITAAILQEHVGDYSRVESIVKRSIEILSEKGVDIVRADWLREAAHAERSGFKVTSREIIKQIVGWKLKDDDKLKTWLEDVKVFLENGSINCARAVFTSIISDKDIGKLESVWLEYAQFEKTHGTRESLLDALRSAVEPSHCIKSERIWLMLADPALNELDGSRQVLSNALDANPDSEKIVIAAVELECQHGNHGEARRILSDACRSAKTPQLVMKSAKLEWSVGNVDDAIKILRTGVDAYKNFADFFHMLGQIEEQRDNFDQAKTWYSSGLKFNPTSISLWVSSAHLEERTGSVAKARSRLEMARLRNPGNASLWLESAQLELRQFLAKGGNQRSRPDAVTTILAKGIKECKDSVDVAKLIEMQSDIDKRKYA